LKSFWLDALSFQIEIILAGRAFFKFEIIVAGRALIFKFKKLFCLDALSFQI
jgi:hypothetical protein